MPAKKKPAARKPAARRSAVRRRFHLPTLEQRQLDLIGLGLVGLALFFAFLVYFGWDGGRAGSRGGRGPALAARRRALPRAGRAGRGGAILMLRPVLPAVRPFRSGAICVFVAATLGLAAGTIGPGGARPDWWDPTWVKTRGGMVGEGFAWVVTTFTGTIGAHILTIFLFIAGVLLLTGASIAGVIKATTDSVSSTTREIRGAASKRRPARASDDLETLERSPRVRVERPEVFGETPEFETPKPKRAAKKKPAKEDEEQFWSGDERFPDLYGGEPAPEPEPVVESPSPSTSRSSSGSPRTRSRTRRASRAGRPSRSSPSSSRRRAATAARSPTRPTSSGSSRTPPSSRARPRRPRGPTPPARRRSPRS